MYISEEGIILAKDAHCIIEDLHYDLQVEDLIEYKAIGHSQIKSFEVNAKYLTFKTTKGGSHDMYFESIDSLKFAIKNLKKVGYSLVKHKKSSRLLLIISCFFGTKAALTVSFLAIIISWVLALILCVITLTNFAGLLTYR